MGREEGMWRRRYEVGRGEESKRCGRGLGPWNPVLLQDELPTVFSQRGKGSLLCAEFRGDLGYSVFPFLSSSLGPCLSTGRVLDPKEPGNAGISIVNQN